MSEYVPTTEDVRAGLLSRVMDTLAYYQCRETNPKADHPLMGYHAFSEDQREWLREKKREAAEEIVRIMAEHDAEVAAKAWSEGWSARASRGYAHLKVGECVPPPAHINPYRKAVQ